MAKEKNALGDMLDSRSGVSWAEGLRQHRSGHDRARFLRLYYFGDPRIRNSQMHFNLVMLRYGGVRVFLDVG